MVIRIELVLLPLEVLSFKGLQQEPLQYLLGYRARKIWQQIMSIFQLPKNSGNSGWNVNGTRLFGSKPLEIFQNKWNSWKGRPVFPLETSQWKICVSITAFSSLLFLSPVPYSQASLGSLNQMKLVTNGMRFSLTEIPNRNFPKFFVNGKRPMCCCRVGTC